ncbi:MAG: DinB family protein [Bacteroidota bacterium]
MNKDQLVSLLRDNHAAFLSQIQKCSDAGLCYAPDGKWTAIQQLDHIVRSVKPVNMAFGLPKFILQWRFGTANRPSKSYEQLIEKYQGKLQEGGRASGQFVPPAIGAESKQGLLNQLSDLVNSLARKTENISEASLDKYILPHPLLGKLTLREMLYFTAYHVQHHQALVEKGLVNR